MTDARLIEKPKPCPFCGAEAKETKTDIGPGYRTSQVRCTKCPADLGKSGLDAAAYWNTRATPEPTPLTEEEKREAVKVMAEGVEEYKFGGHISQMLVIQDCEAALSALLERFDLRRRG